MLIIIESFLKIAKISIKKNQFLLFAVFFFLIFFPMNNNMVHTYDDDHFHDECGVIGIFSPHDMNVANLAYYGLFSLQHRGQEGAGIATASGNNVEYYKKKGLVSEVFTQEVLDNLFGNIAIGHVRYSTTGENTIANVQPLVVKYRKGFIAIAHNGNLVNTTALRNDLENSGAIFQTSIDTELIANLFARYHSNGIENALHKVMEQIEGAYSLVIITQGKLIGVRDPHGFRPLCIGKMDNAYVLASETCALDTLGAQFVRDVEPGEIVIIDENGLQSIPSNVFKKNTFCIFELIYFARPDSNLEGHNAHSYRYKTGRILAEEAPVQADRVIAVPDSGIPAAIGFSEASGIPFGVGLIKNRYTGRTFIQPNQALREQGVRIKLNVLKKNVEGKRVVIIDDSIVRGTTIKRIVKMLKDSGAKEVHLRISSPPVTHPCHFGIDTPDKEQLIGAQMTVPEIANLLQVDSLAYISVEGMLKATGKKSGFCDACFTGNYPIQITENNEKNKFEV